MTDLTLKIADFPVAEKRDYRPCRGGVRSGKVPPELCDRLYGRVTRELKSSRNTHCFLAESPLGEVFVKEYRSNGFFRRLRRLFCPSRAIRTLKATLALEEFVPVPELLLAISRKRFPAVEQKVVTAAYPSPLSACDRMTELAGEKREDFAAKIAEMVNAIHRRGVYHGDLKMQNILCKIGDDGQITLGLFDFDGAKVGRSPVGGRRRHREWARIISSFVRVCGAEGIPVDAAEARRVFQRAAGGLDDGELGRQLAKFARKGAGKAAKRRSENA